MAEVNTEQWKAEGDCKNCRRQPYCTKECGAKKRRDERFLRNYSRAIFQGVAGSEMTERAIEQGWL